MSAVCHGNLSTCHFGHMCHRFPSPVTRILHHQDEKVPLHLSLYSSTRFQDMEDRDIQGVLVSYTAELTGAGLEQLILLNEYLVILMMNILMLLWRGLSWLPLLWGENSRCWKTHRTSRGWNRWKGHRMAVMMSYEPLAIQLHVATPRVKTLIYTKPLQSSLKYLL